MYYCECKGKIKWGRPGTEATQTPPKINEGSGDISPITQALLIAFDLHKVFQPPITLQNTLSAVAIHESLAVYFSTMTKHFILVHKLVITLYSKVMKQLNVTRSSPLRVGRGVVLAWDYHQEPGYEAMSSMLGERVLCPSSYANTERDCLTIIMAIVKVTISAWSKTFNGI